ncbi:hypothetical protein GH714_018856 [Hevea brasiliensis]|uniref:J domain-containing protein n=1 Tax=Hevea brasiliensis TaxID=3981 RepID=A0A6A6K9D4_HEVBR|nr:hypothetical protein GH714_018856 [Hevea brasiliensis]
MKPKLEILVPLLHKTRSRQKTYKIKIITCRYNANYEVARATQEKKANFYRVLSLESQNVGFDEIKKAYRNMALQYHPDVCPPSTKEESTKRFVELRQAYETLSDPISRRLTQREVSMHFLLPSRLE